MILSVETEQETDGRWIAEIPQIAGVFAYGGTRQEAVARAEALASRVLAERVEHGEPAMNNSAGRLPEKASGDF